MFQPSQATRVEKMRFFDIRIAFSLCLVLWNCITEAQHGGMGGDGKLCFLFLMFTSKPFLSWLLRYLIVGFKVFLAFKALAQHLNGFLLGYARNWFRFFQ